MEKKLVSSNQEYVECLESILKIIRSKTNNILKKLRLSAKLLSGHLLMLILGTLIFRIPQKNVQNLNFFSESLVASIKLVKALELVHLVMCITDSLRSILQMKYIISIII